MRVGDNKGFSLIEVIVVLVISAVLGTVLVQFLNTSYFKSPSPIQIVNDSITLQNIIENITSDYNANFTTDLYGLSSNIGSVGSDQDNDYGVYRVSHNGFIQFNSGTEEDDSSGSNTLLKIILVRIGDDNEDAEFITVLFDLQ